MSRIKWHPVQIEPHRYNLPDPKREVLVFDSDIGVYAARFSVHPMNLEYARFLYHRHGTLHLDEVSKNCFVHRCWERYSHAGYDTFGVALPYRLDYYGIQEDHYWAYIDDIKF